MNKWTEIVVTYEAPDSWLCKEEAWLNLNCVSLVLSLCLHCPPNDVNDCGLHVNGVSEWSVVEWGRRRQVIARKGRQEPGEGRPVVGWQADVLTVLPRPLRVSCCNAALIGSSIGEASEEPLHEGQLGTWLGRRGGILQAEGMLLENWWAGRGKGTRGPIRIPGGLEAPFFSFCLFFLQSEGSMNKVFKRLG